MPDLSVLQAAREVPEHPCVISSDHQWTYAEVAERVRGAIAWLEGKGVTGGDATARVALTPTVSLDSAIMIYALIELGVPMVLLHPRWPESQRRAALENTKPLLVIERPSADRAPLSADRAPLPADHAPLSGDLCLAIIHTSGTQAVPKSVVLSRRSFIAAAEASAQNLGWHHDDRWLVCMPPAHVGGLSIFTRTLLARRTIVLAGQDGFDPQEVVRLIDDRAVTLLSLVPTMLKRLLENAPSWKAPSSLRAVLVGGAPLASRLRLRAIEHGLPVLSTYGCTEACSQVSTQSLDQLGTDGSGMPLGGVQLRFRNRMIEIAGPTLADGYLIDGSVAPLGTDGWFRTGDLGELTADRQLRVLGRADDMIITGGENVSPVTVEAFLESIPGVDTACVFGVPDEEWGQRVVAALVCHEHIEPGALQANVRAGLSPHERPKQVCQVDRLPTTSLGKLDRGKAAAELASSLKPL